MSGFGSQSVRLIAVLTLVLLGGAAQSQSRLQNVADDAALAAAQVLGAGGGTHEAALAAHQNLAASASGVASEVTAAPSGKIVTVKVSQPRSKAEAVSTVRYVPPEQPATWQWAARQRFVLNTSPMIVGSVCPQGCDPVR